ncbi:MAG: ribonuclease domain-containing protein [bacterium]
MAERKSVRLFKRTANSLFLLTFSALYLAPLSCSGDSGPCALSDLKQLALNTKDALDSTLLPEVDVLQADNPPPQLEVPPGNDISPYLDDPGRVTVILKLLSDIYYHQPLQFPQDGTVFNNREGLLPPQPAGYYREYTVLAPKGSPSVINMGGQTYHVPPSTGARGTERLVIGGGEKLYYTPDHYRNFIEFTVLRKF